MSPALAGGLFTTSITWEAHSIIRVCYNYILNFETIIIIILTILLLLLSSLPLLLLLLTIALNF